MPTDHSPFVPFPFCVEMATAWRCLTQHSKMHQSLVHRLHPYPGSFLGWFFYVLWHTLPLCYSSFAPVWCRLPSSGKCVSGTCCLRGTFFWMCAWYKYVSVLVSLRDYSSSWTPLQARLDWDTLIPPITTPAVVSSGEQESPQTSAGGKNREKREEKMIGER